MNFCLLARNGRIATLLAMPPALVNFSWAMVRGKRDNVQHISFTAAGEQACFPPFLQ
jgi:hypothetical protein